MAMESANDMEAVIAEALAKAGVNTAVRMDAAELSSSDTAPVVKVQTKTAPKANKPKAKQTVFAPVSPVPVAPITPSTDNPGNKALLEVLKTGAAQKAENASNGDKLLRFVTDNMLDVTMKVHHDSPYYNKVEQLQLMFAVDTMTQGGIVLTAYVSCNSSSNVGTVEPVQEVVNTDKPVTENEPAAAEDVSPVGIVSVPSPEVTADQLALEGVIAGNNEGVIECPTNSQHSAEKHKHAHASDPYTEFNLEQLQAEKQRLTALIAEAKAANNLEAFNNYKKLRRLVRKHMKENA